jgi:hypothetical protein
MRIFLIYFIVVLIFLSLISCSGYFAQKYKIIYGTLDIYCGSRIPILIEGIDLIEDVLIEISKSFDLKAISIEEARERYFWLDPGLNVIFAYYHPMSEEFYNLIICMKTYPEQELVI